MRTPAPKFVHPLPDSRVVLRELNLGGEGKRLCKFMAEVGNFCRSMSCSQVILQLCIEILATCTSWLVGSMTAEQKKVNYFQTSEHYFGSPGAQNLASPLFPMWQLNSLSPYSQFSRCFFVSFRCHKTDQTPFSSSRCMFLVCIYVYMCVGGGVTWCGSFEGDIVINEYSPEAAKYSEQR